MGRKEGKSRRRKAKQMAADGATDQEIAMAIFKRDSPIFVQLAASMAGRPFVLKGASRGRGDS